MPVSKSLVPGLCVLVALACASATPPPVEVAPQAENEVMFYALGRAIAAKLSDLQLIEVSDPEREFLLEGTGDALARRNSPIPLPKEDDVRLFLQKRLAETAEHEKQASQPFLAAAAAAEGAVTLPSGAIVQVLAPGDGATSRDLDAVRLRYEGKLRDGTVFTSNLADEEPRTFLVRGLIPCWSEAVIGAAKGAQLRVTCPPELAFGDQGSPPLVKPGTALVFEIQLVDVVVRE